MPLMDDVRYAIRQFGRAPGFTATAVLLKSLPVAKPGELIRVGNVENCCVNGGLEDNWSLFSYDKYKTFRDGTPGFVQLAAFQSGGDLIGARRAGSKEPAE